jgi:hypothetical protein
VVVVCGGAESTCSMEGYSGFDQICDNCYESYILDLTKKILTIFRKGIFLHFFSRFM